MFSTRCSLSASRFVLVAAGLCLIPPALSAAPFIRGDSDADESINITDAVRVLGHLFLGDPGILACQDAADADDSGTILITDAVYVLSHLFLGGPAPAAPFPACGEDPTADELGCDIGPSCEGWKTARSDLKRDPSPELGEGDLEELVRGNTAFAMDLYSRLRGSPGNLFFSPLSISFALAMTYAGARGETQGQMARALRFTLPQERLHPAFNYLDLELSSRGQGAAGHAGGGFQLKVVNATWGQDGYAFLPPYLDVLALHYDAGLRILDFMGDPERCRGVINEWVLGETAGRIVDLLPQGTVLPTTRLVLTNAIYFSAAWNEPFPVELTRDRAFHFLDGTSVDVPTMSLRTDLPFAIGEGYQAVELPYDGRELSMVVVVPDEGKFVDFEESLSPERVAIIVAGLRTGDVQVSLPRFSSESSFGLADALTAMGMTDAFRPGAADLSGMDGTRELFISSVVHKSFVAVDEAGTEAAAATGVVVGIVSVPPEVRVERPFIFAIRDIPTGTILFLGRVMDPRG